MLLMFNFFIYTNIDLADTVSKGKNGKRGKYRNILDLLNHRIYILRILCFPWFLTKFPNSLCIDNISNFPLFSLAGIFFLAIFIFLVFFYQFSLCSGCFPGDSLYVGLGTVLGLLREVRVVVRSVGSLFVFG